MRETACCCYFMLLQLSRGFITTWTLPRSTTRTMMMSASSIHVTTLPELCVFDMDMCIWSPEMYELNVIPTTKDGRTGRLGERGEGIVAVTSGYEDIQIFPAALKILQDYCLGLYGPTLRIAAASSADTPRAVAIGRAAMDILEVLPGVTLRQCFARGWPAGFEGNLQIGRTPPLSADKAATHFPILLRETNVAYSKMIFFDDCNWGDHCANVERNCPGVVTMRTPRGLQEREWVNCLKAYDQKYGTGGSS